MAKRYYWLKLKEDFFAQPRIKKLRKVAGGDTYTLIYLKMQLLSLKNEGVLIFEGVEKTFAEELALTIDEEPENVQFTLMYLLNQGIMEETSENEYAMLETQQCIGSETKNAQSMRELREKRAITSECNNVTPCYTMLTEKRREEKDIDIELEKDTEIELSSSSSSSAEAANLSAMMMYNDVPIRKGDYQELERFTNNLLSDYWDVYTDESDISIVFEIVRKRMELPNGEVVAVLDTEKQALLKRAFFISKENGERAMNWKYVRGILQRWEYHGLQNIAEIEQHELERINKKLEQAV